MYELINKLNVFFTDCIKTFLFLISEVLIFHKFDFLISTSLKFDTLLLPIGLPLPMVYNYLFVYFKVGLAFHDRYIYTNVI
jgi:hypothetical protein